MNNNTDEFADFRTTGNIPNEAFAQLNKLVADYINAQKEVATQEAKLKKAQENLRRLEEFDIPTQMETLSLSEFTTQAGFHVKVCSKIRASIGKAKVAAHRWLIDNGHSAIIKRTIAIAFNTNQGKEAETLLDELRKRKVGVAVKQDMKVEPATLTSFVKKQLENGQEIPKDLFGVFEQRFVKISLPQ